MATGAYNESAYENAVLEVLRAMKWEYMYGPDVERDYSDPTLPDVFKYQVRRLNKGVPDEAVNDAIRQVRGIAGGSVVVRNAMFTDFLQNGVDGACRVAGDDTTRLVQLVDYAHPEKNTFHALCEPIDVSQGSVSRAPVHPRDVFCEAVRYCAFAIIVAHNHPSGGPEPSKEDIEATECLIETGRLLGIRLVDHLVLGSPDSAGGRGFVSIRNLAVLGF